jgi:multidrug efflux pump
VIYIFFDTLGQRLTGRRPSHTAPRNEPPRGQPGEQPA